MLQVAFLNIILSYNTCLSKTRVKVECVIGQLKHRFRCLNKGLEYEPDKVCNIIRACCFLWNFGLITGDNAGYDPNSYVVPEKDELAARLMGTAGGCFMREEVKEYLWQHCRN